MHPLDRLSHHFSSLAGLNPSLPDGPGLALAVLGLALAVLGGVFDFWSAPTPSTLPFPAGAAWVEVVPPGQGPALLAFPSVPTLNEVAAAAGAASDAARSDTLIREPAKVTFPSPERISLGPLSGPAELALGCKLDLNRASARDLALLPGLGPATAARIITERSRRGGFTDLSEIDQIRGIREGTAKNISAWVRVK
ncbi:MAG: helix-hairpin-helix domain-containing protein [Thermodesulfobacteriota bacterium]